MPPTYTSKHCQTESSNSKGLQYRLDWSKYYQDFKNGFFEEHSTGIEPEGYESSVLRMSSSLDGRESK